MVTVRRIRSTIGLVGVVRDHLSIRDPRAPHQPVQRAECIDPSSIERQVAVRVADLRNGVHDVVLVHSPGGASAVTICVGEWDRGAWTCRSPPRRNGRPLQDRVGSQQLRSRACVHRRDVEVFHPSGQGIDDVDRFGAPRAWRESRDRTR